MIENFKLRVFRTVAETLNFSKAADELHLSQPAVTSQIRTLEEGLGISLFDRVGRNATLTPAGKTLLPYVRQIEALTNEALAALAPFGRAGPRSHRNAAIAGLYDRRRQLQISSRIACMSVIRFTALVRDRGIFPSPSWQVQGER